MIEFIATCHSNTQIRSWDERVMIEMSGPSINNSCLSKNSFLAGKKKTVKSNVSPVSTKQNSQPNLHPYNSNVSSTTKSAKIARRHRSARNNDRFTTTTTTTTIHHCIPHDNELCVQRDGGSERERQKEASQSKRWLMIRFGSQTVSTTTSTVQQTLKQRSDRQWHSMLPLLLLGLSSMVPLPLPVMMIHVLLLLLLS